MAARRYARRHLDTVALMKCMGAPQRFVLAQTVVQLVAIAVVTAVAGTAIGYVAQSGIGWLLNDLVRGELPPPTVDASLLGIITAVVDAGGICTATAVATEACAPGPRATTQSRTATAAIRRRVRYGDGRGGGAVVLVVRDPKLLAYVAGGLAATFVVLIVAGWALVKLLTPLRGSVGVAWRYGIANIARRGRDSIIQIVAFGLGFMVLLLLGTGT